MAIKKFHDPIYGAQIIIIIGEPVKAVHKCLENNNGSISFKRLESLYATATAFVHSQSKGKMCFFVVFKERKLSLDTIVHECFHLVSQVFERIGIALNSGSEEAWSHYLECIFRTVYNVFKSIKSQQQSKKK